MMLSGGMGGGMGGQMNPLMLSLLMGDDVPKSKSSYDKICAADPACAAEVAKIYNADGVSIFFLDGIDGFFDGFSLDSQRILIGFSSDSQRILNGFPTDSLINCR